MMKKIETIYLIEISSRKRFENKYSTRRKKRKSHEVKYLKINVELFNLLNLETNTTIVCSKMSTIAG